MPPPLDVAVGSKNAVLAIVAWDWRGNLVFGFSNKVDTNILVQAEAEAILLYYCSEV
jgi:hypothetical protein